MPLPRKVVKEIIGTCRAFLWNGSAECDGPGKAACAALCEKKVAGGLGVRDIVKWNCAALFKHLWAIEKKKDVLWVKWVNQIYLKQKNIWEVTAETNNSWYWRKLLEVRDTFCQLDAVEQIRKKDSYLIMDGYRILTREQRREKKFAQVWNPMNVPKHSFILWLVLKQRIMTKERASRFIQLDNIDCSLCKDEAETTQHLFFQCQIVQEWLKEIKDWLGWRTHKIELHDLLLWIQRGTITKFRRMI